MATRKEMVVSGAMLTEAVGVNGSFEYNIDLTGKAGQGAKVITTSNTVIKTTVAGTGDSITLPQGDAGDWLQVFNYSANTVKVYPPVGWAIHGGATNAAVNLTAGKVGQFTQMTDPVKATMAPGFTVHEYAFGLSA